MMAWWRRRRVTLRTDPWALAAVVDAAWRRYADVQYLSEAGDVRPELLRLALERLEEDMPAAVVDCYDRRTLERRGA